MPKSSDAEAGVTAGEGMLRVILVSPPALFAGDINWPLYLWHLPLLALLLHTCPSNHSC